LIPLASFVLGFALGYVRVARAGGVMADRVHRGIVTGLALALLSLFLGFLLEAAVKT
jgi:uncharacterized membrane protein